MLLLSGLPSLSVNAWAAYTAMMAVLLGLLSLRRGLERAWQRGRRQGRRSQRRRRQCKSHRGPRLKDPKPFLWPGFRGQ